MRRSCEEKYIGYRTVNMNFVSEFTQGIAQKRTKHTVGTRAGESESSSSSSSSSSSDIRSHQAGVHTLARRGAQSPTQQTADLIYLDTHAGDTNSSSSGGGGGGAGAVGSGIGGFGNSVLVIYCGRGYASQHGIRTATSLAF